MSNDGESQFSIETRVRGDEVRVVVDRGKQKLGKLVLSGGTICWVPAEPHGDDEAQKMAWVMTWEQFAEAMQSSDLRKVVRLSESAYASAFRAAATTVQRDTGFDAEMPTTREKLGLQRRFNITELSLIQKGYTPYYDEPWIMNFDSVQRKLRMYRIKTGYCIYSIKFEEEPNGGEISESWVNRAPRQYESTSTKHDAEVANWLIDVYLLGGQRDFPSVSNSDDVI